MRDILAVAFLQLTLAAVSFLFVYVQAESEVLARLVYAGAIVCGCIPLALGIIRSPANLDSSLLCINAFNLAPIWFLYLEGLVGKTGTATELPPMDRLMALAVALLFQSGANLCYVLLASSLQPVSYSVNHSIVRLSLPPKFLGLLGIATFVGPLLIFGFIYGSLGELWESLTAGRNGEASGVLVRRSSLGGSEALFLPLLWIWQLTPAIASLALTISLTERSPISFGLLASVLCGASVIFFTFLGGSRGTLIFVAAVPLMLWIYYGRRLGALFGILSVALFFLIIGVMEFQVRNRGGMLEVLAGSGAGYGTVGDGDSTTFNPLESHRDNNLYFLALIVRGIPHDYPHEGLNDYFAYIVNPIPRAVWPGKPVLSGARNLREINPVYQSGPLSVGTTSLSSSIVGEAFLWSGYLGFFLLYGIYMPFCSWFDSWFVHEPKNNVIQIGIQGFAAFLALWGYRSLNAFVTFSYVFLLLYLGAMVASKLRYSLNSYSTALRAEVNP